jgi:hypothetical protein
MARAGPPRLVLRNGSVNKSRCSGVTTKNYLDRISKFLLSCLHFQLTVYLCVNDRPCFYDYPRLNNSWTFLETES